MRHEHLHRTSPLFLTLTLATSLLACGPEHAGSTTTNAEASAEDTSCYLTSSSQTERFLLTCGGARAYVEDCTIEEREGVSWLVCTDEVEAPLQGMRGVDGMRGADGVDGVDGMDGMHGADGVEGQSASVTTRELAPGEQGCELGGKEVVIASPGQDEHVLTQCTPGVAPPCSPGHILVDGVCVDALIARFSGTVADTNRVGTSVGDPCAMTIIAPLSTKLAPTTTALDTSSGARTILELGTETLAPHASAELALSHIHTVTPEVMGTDLVYRTKRILELASTGFEGETPGAFSTATLLLAPPERIHTRLPSTTETFPPLPIWRAAFDGAAGSDASRAAIRLSEPGAQTTCHLERLEALPYP